jgi:hypothetical protein
MPDEQLETFEIGEASRDSPALGQRVTRTNKGVVATRAGEPVARVLPAAAEGSEHAIDREAILARLSQ